MLFCDAGVFGVINYYGIVCYTLLKMCFFIIIVRRYFLEDFKEIEKWIYGLVNFTHQMLSTACV